TKSMTGADLRLPAGSTATLAPTNPALSAGFAALSALTASTSEANEGADVCSTARSQSRAFSAIRASLKRCGGEPINLLFSTKAAAWASEVRYQTERILLSAR